MNNNKSYPAKLFLFGEYTVLSGSRALALPLSIWNGTLKSGAPSRDPHLVSLTDYLREHRVFAVAPIEKLQHAVEKGLYFDSNIPQGYGVGSSGALCAAIYDGFFSDPDFIPPITGVRDALALMEGHFHGKSSGMDPLVSLRQAPVLRERDAYHVLPPLNWPEDLRVFLIDSGQQRTTDQLVHQYMEWTTQEPFIIQCLRPLIQSVDHAISFLLEAHVPAFWEHLKLISQLHYTYFKPMITDNISSIWETSLQQEDVAIKLCGAGGGGFYLGFAKDGMDIKAVVGDHLRVVQITEESQFAKDS